MTPTKAELSRAVRLYHGVRARLVAHYRMSRERLRRLLDAYGLAALADDLAAARGVTGPRAYMSDDFAARDRARVLAALAKWGATRGAAELGMSRPGIYRRRSRYGITAAEIGRARGR